MKDACDVCVLIALLRRAGAFISPQRAHASPHLFVVPGNWAGDKTRVRKLPRDAPRFAEAGHCQTGFSGRVGLLKAAMMTPMTLPSCAMVWQTWAFCWRLKAGRVPAG